MSFTGAFLLEYVLWSLVYWNRVSLSISFYLHAPSRDAQAVRAPAVSTVETSSRACAGLGGAACRAHTTGTAHTDGGAENMSFDLF